MNVYIGNTILKPLILPPYFLQEEIPRHTDHASLYALLVYRPYMDDKNNFIVHIWTLYLAVSSIYGR